ncbi:MAG: hypothetical protein D6765_12880 [Bacteroidetes bacterium]|nr:MAG: hypothetical protein D6765_12880 [Bacteroidota bacterium]
MLLPILWGALPLPAQTTPPVTFEAVVKEIQKRRLPASAQNDDGSFIWAFLLVSREDFKGGFHPKSAETASRFLLHYNPATRSYHGDLLNLRPGTSRPQALSTLLAVLQTNLATPPGIPDVCTVEGRRYYLLKF